MKKVEVITKRRKPELKAVAKKQEPKKTALSKKMNEKRDFSRRVQTDMESILPNKMPWKIGIKEDIIEALKDKYVGKERSLTRVVNTKLRYKTDSLEYMEAMQSESCRYGIGLVQYPLSDEHRRHCQSKITKVKNLKSKKKVSKCTTV